MKTDSVTSSKSAIVTAKTNLKQKESKLFTWVKAKKAMIISCICGACFDAMTMTAHATDGGGGAGAGASGGSGADAKWDAVINFILPWITRLGGVVILIGAVEFGLAFKSDDAEGKTRGMRTIIAGCIVTAVGLSSSTFLS